ncbi:MAG: hypothetical protein OEZ06_31830 [Myxococcales bacterium]|nr:hypothetical protein [Myxococcales bacterium]
MLLVLTFWLAVCLPGLWLVARFGGAAARSPLGMVAGGCVASFLLFSPLSIAGYLFGLPIAVLWIAVIASALVACAMWLVKRPWSLPRPSAVGSLASLVLLSDLWLATRTGGHQSGDATYHVGRIRLLLDHGFNQWDPFVAKEVFDRIYHTNLYHALMATCADVTGLDPLEVWAYSWPFAKLVAAAASAELAFVLTGRSWLSWLAASMTAVWTAPGAIGLYPNQLAPQWLLVLAIAVVVRQLHEGPSRRGALELAAIACVLPQVHGLYWIFLCMLVGPLLLVMALWPRGGVRNSRMLAWACIGALAVGAPFVARSAAPQIARLLRPPPPKAATAAAAGDKKAAAPAATPKGFVRLEDDQLMMDAAGFLNPRSNRLQLLGLLGLGLLTVNRRRYALLSAILLCAGAWLYVPPLCTLLVKALGAPWMVARLSAVFSIVYLPLLPSTLLLLLPARLAVPPLQLAALGAVIALAHVRGADNEPWSRAAYLERAFTTPELPAQLAEEVDKARALKELIPPRTSVWTRLERDHRMAMLCDCAPLAVREDRGSRGLGPEMTRRRDAHAAIANLDLPYAERLALLREFQVRAFVLWSGQRTRRLQQAYRPLLTGSARSGKMHILAIDPMKAQ